MLLSAAELLSCLDYSPENKLSHAPKDQKETLTVKGVCNGCCLLSGDGQRNRSSIICDFSLLSNGVYH